MKTAIKTALTAIKRWLALYRMRSIEINLASAIASIGAVWFEPRGGRLGNTFHLHVDLEDCQRHGLTIGFTAVFAAFVATH